MIKIGELNIKEIYLGELKIPKVCVGEYKVYEEGAKTPPNDEIWYTSTDGNVVEPYRTNAFTKNIISNTYVNGKGVIKFDGDVNFNNQDAFINKTTLESISLPNSVTRIGSSAFQSCSKLTSIEMPNSVTSIGNNAFKSCSSLTRLNSDVDGVFNIPSGVTSIGSSAFSECSSLTSVTIPSGVTSIGSSAFQSCSSLTRLNSNVDGVINFQNSLNTIEINAFVGVTNITSVTIPNGVTRIGSDAFKDFPTEGYLDCSEEWYASLNDSNYNNLGVVKDWETAFPKPEREKGISFPFCTQEYIEGQGYQWLNASDLRNMPFLTDGVSMTFGDGGYSTPPKHYLTTLRIYSANTITITAPENYVLTSVTFETTSSYAMDSTKSSVNQGAIVDANIWEGETNQLVITRSTSTQFRPSSAMVYLKKVEDGV